MSSLVLLSSHLGRELIAILLLSSNCHVVDGFLRIYPMVPWVGMECAIVAFSGHVHLLIVTNQLT